ncbi:hypothetical protein [Brevundimonas naejangsanensis]|uniref:hypothetical protein n=1 Tax=Brevundimonas naejangsanensis TaxID=588932 RepID=UPI0039F6EC93
MIEARSNAAGLDLERVRAAARRALVPLQPTNALPPDYLVRFLLIDLLGFRNNGRFDKVAWSVPIDLDGRAFLIEHRKFGLGVFGGSTPEDLEGAKALARLLHRGVKASKAYFTWLAEEAGRPQH